MDFPENLKYTSDHEWVKIDGDIATVGITDFAQDALGDIVFIELPKPGDKVQKDKSVAVVESVKSVSDVLAPVSGEIVEVNEEIEAAPEKVNTNPYESGWMFRIRLIDPDQTDGFLDDKEYQKLIFSK